MKLCLALCCCCYCKFYMLSTYFCFFNFRSNVFFLIVMTYFYYFYALFYLFLMPTVMGRLFFSRSCRSWEGTVHLLPLFSPQGSRRVNGLYAPPLATVSLHSIQNGTNVKKCLRDGTQILRTF